MSEQPTPRAQVLIVEDEPDHADVMADALRRPGHVSTIVNSVEAALDELRHGSFDVVVTDLQMPGMDGYEILKYIRSNPGTAQIPVLMLIAETDTTHLLLPPNEAADRYITKPFTARKVLDVVKEFIVYKGL